MNILFAWIGHSDLRAPSEPGSGIGPIAHALSDARFDVAILLDNYPPDQCQEWHAWLEKRTTTELHIRRAPLSGPTELGEIYTQAVAAVQDARRQFGSDAHLTFHLSPGTSAMAAVWLLLAKARFGADLVETSKEQGYRKVEVPFDIAADFLPDLLKQSDARLSDRLSSTPPRSARFGDIVYASDVMARVVGRAAKVALRSVPVLILGESGTGKELMARAIHSAGPRANAQFIAVNCGAIPAELVESELFGHEKGAFTGAANAHVGVFELADRGTLFLDEIGELPLATQVKLLRVLQDGELRRLGATKSRKINARIIAATHRDLSQAVATGGFREDLYFRLAVAVLHLPPLRERHGDLAPLVDYLWQVVTKEAQEDRSWQDKKLSASAKQALLRHPWPGNVRELLNTLHRLCLWSEGEIVTADDVKDALLATSPLDRVVTDQQLGDGFSLPDLLAETARSHLTRAMADAGQNKTRAAQMLGLASYQTLTNWLSKYGVIESPPISR